MTDSLSISPVALSSPAGIPPAAFALPKTGTPAPVMPSFAGGGSVVELSTNGRLLSAIFSFRSALETLPVNTADSSPANLAATARSLVAAFTDLQNSSTSLPNLAATPPGNALATAARSSNAGTLLALQNIGIDLLSAAATTPDALDLTIFSNAIAADPVATQTTLAAATRGLIDQADTLEADIVSTVVLPSIPLPVATIEPARVVSADSPPQPGSVQEASIGIGTPINPQPEPPATTPLPAVAAAPAFDPRPALAPDDAGSAEVLPLPLPPTDVPDVLIANTVPADQPNPPATTGAASPPLAVPPPAIAAPIPTPTPATVPTVTPPPLAADVIAAERRANVNTIALQTLLSDPRLRALDNHADPAYAAVIAASHLSDFDSPRPFTDARALATDTIGPVSALLRVRAIADYREAAGEPQQRTLIGTSTTRQYWI